MNFCWLLELSSVKLSQTGVGLRFYENCTISYEYDHQTSSFVSLKLCIWILQIGSVNMQEWKGLRFAGWGAFFLRSQSKPTRACKHFNIWSGWRFCVWETLRCSRFSCIIVGMALLETFVTVHGMKKFGLNLFDFLDYKALCPMLAFLSNP